MGLGLSQNGVPAQVDGTRSQSAQVDGTRSQSAQVDETRSQSAQVDGTQHLFLCLLLTVVLSCH